jgi:hypothetical protein
LNPKEDKKPSQHLYSLFVFRNRKVRRKLAGIWNLEIGI